MKTLRLSAALALTLLLTTVGNAFAQEPQFSASQIQAILEQVQRDCPEPWANAHREGDPRRWDFAIYAAERLYRVSGGTVGGNWRRANVGDFSMDGVSVAFVDHAGNVTYRFADYIVGAGGSNPRLSYHTPGPDALLRDSSGNYAPHGFVKAADLPRPVSKCTADGSGTVVEPVPPTGPPTMPPAATPAAQAILEAIQGLRAQVDALAGRIGALEVANSLVRGDAQTAASAALDAKNTLERIEPAIVALVDQGARISIKLDNPPALKGSILGIGVTLRPAAQ